MTFTAMVTRLVKGAASRATSRPRAVHPRVRWSVIEARSMSIGPCATRVRVMAFASCHARAALTIDAATAPRRTPQPGVETIGIPSSRRAYSSHSAIENPCAAAHTK